MGYEELKEYMVKFHLGEISRVEMAAAFCMWQRAEEDFSKGDK